MKSNREFKRKITLKKFDDDPRKQINFARPTKKVYICKTMKYKYGKKVLNTTFKDFNTSAMMRPTTAAAPTSAPTLSLYSSLTAKKSMKLWKTKQITAANNHNLAVRQTCDGINKLREIQGDPLQQQPQQQQLQQTELKHRLQNNNGKTTSSSPAKPLKSIIFNNISDGDTLLADTCKIPSSRFKKINNEGRSNSIYGNDELTRANAKRAYKIDEDTINTARLATITLTASLPNRHLLRAYTNSRRTTTSSNSTTTICYQPFSFYHEIDKRLSRFKFWLRTPSVTRLTTTDTNYSSLYFSSSKAIWLLALVSMFTLFGYGNAGFACLSNPCVFGVCIDGLNSSYSCYCIDGYTGIQCQTNWDECWSAPCQNGGVCIDGVAYYNCTCPDGFSGTNCEENVDECMSNPCQNGGHCRDRNNGYTCTCQPGYLGDHCEVDIAVCETGTGARCQNGGECIEGRGLEFSCKCAAGWYGRICQDEINECDSSPCQNGGVCVDKMASYVCACPMGYTGTNCEEEILICADNPCQNNALCLMEESVPTCYCVPDYHGEKCEYQYDECQLGPRCMNGGVCIDGVDTFSCSCPPLLTGMLCECLMIGEDSLDCNYTAPPTTAPATQKPRLTPILTTPKATDETRLLSSTDSSISVTKSVLNIDNDESKQVTAEEEESIERPEIIYSTKVTPALQSKEDDSTEHLVTYTTESSASYDVDSKSRSETSYVELINGLEDGDASQEATTIHGFDFDTSSDFTTVKPIETSDGLEDYGSEIHSEESSATGDESTIGSEEDQSEIYIHPTRPIYSQHVTTFETIYTIEYTTPRYNPPIPSYYPTFEIPHVTTRPETDSHILSPTEVATPGDYHHGYDVTVPHITRPQISTTVAPFFTEYPEVVVTTKYVDIVKESGGISTPTPTYKVITTTTSSYDTSAIEATTDIPAISVTVRLPENRTYMQHIPTVIPKTNNFPTTTFIPKAPEYDVTTHRIDTVETTPQSFYTEDMTSNRITTTGTSIYAPHDLPMPTTHIPSTVSSTPTDFKPIITYVPPTYAQTSPRPTFLAPTVPPIQPSEMPQPTYGTQPPIVSKSTPARDSSSEEDESANTVEPPTSGGAGHADTDSHSDCVKHGCFNGGTCVTTSEGSRCVCRFDRQGALCEIPIIIKNAAFSGDSYVSHRIHKDIPHHDALDTVLPMHVQLKVRTRATNGLIMLAAAQGTKGGHYMALFLQKGLLQFQFSCGLQTMLLSELETPVNTGHEITIRAELDFSRNYTHCNASLLVNDTLAMSGDQPTWLKLLPSRLHTPETILNTWLHLGGAPQAPIGLIIELPPSQSGTGFTGCLHSLKINEEIREIFSDALDGFGITECGSLACLSSPCRNGAACIKIETNDVDENGDKMEKWKCKCPTGYMGPTCEISVCEDNPCQYGGTCVQFPGSGYLCLCPLGKHGHYCEHNLEVALPSFSGSVNGLSSFVAYTVPIPLEYSMELSFKILPQTMSQIALLAFLGQSGYHDEKSDHLAISFIQGYIMLTWNLGAGPRRIFTQKPIDFRLDAPRVPYEIKVGRIGRQAWLSVDGKFNITGRSPGSVSRMDVMPILYLGGHEMANFNTLPHDLPLHSGFQGCIYDVHLKAGQVTVPLQDTRGVRGRGVGQCGTRECHRHACQHDGACLQHGATFTCICQEGWYGPLCAQHINPCDSFNNKCSDDSTCVPLVNGYECDCPVGRTGKNCDEEIRALSDVSLTGRRSYLAVRWPYLYDGSDKVGAKRSQIVSYRNFTKKVMPPKPISSTNQHFVMKLLNEVEKQRSFSPVPLMSSKSFEEHHRVQFFFIEFQLRPLSERGLLLYFGTLNNNLDKKIGFVSLSLQGGVVEFRISGPSNHVTVVRSVRMLAIGEWHKIKMAQRGRWLTLWVEGSASSALAPSAEVLIEPEALLYVGGLKDLSKLPHNAISGFPIPFRGCVRGLVVSGTRIVLNETNIIESRNIRDCDGTACGGDSCEAGGHCWLDEKLQPHCICPEYAKGDRCEYSETCKLIPCKNNGRCLRSGRCSCPNGWGGFYCEIALSKPTTPSFRGNSYLILPPPRIPMKDKRKGPPMYTRPRESLQISLNFSTIEPDGLLIWSEHDRSKFLGLGLENGHLKMASNLLGSDNDTVVTSAGGFIIDGSWHMARIIIDRVRLELELDGEIIFTEKLLLQEPIQSSTTPTPFRSSRRNSVITRKTKAPTVTYEDIFYVGGFPYSEPISKRTQGRYEQPFKGCLQDIQFGAEPYALIKDFSTYPGENIGSCDLHGDEIMLA